MNIHYRHRFTSKTWELEKSNFRIFLTIQGFSADCFCLVVPSRRELGLSPPVGSCLPHSLISHVSHCCQTWSLIRLSVINLFFNSNEWINIHLGNVIKSHWLILSRIFCFYRQNNKSIQDQTAVRLEQSVFIIYQAIIQIEIMWCKHFCGKKLPTNQEVQNSWQTSAKSTYRHKFNLPLSFWRLLSEDYVCDFRNDDIHVVSIMIFWHTSRVGGRKRHCISSFMPVWPQCLR